MSCNRSELCVVRPGDAPVSDNRGHSERYRTLSCVDQYLFPESSPHAAGDPPVPGGRVDLDRGVCAQDIAGETVPERIAGSVLFAACVTVALSACQAPPPREISAGHITRPARAASTQIPAPVWRAPFVPPPAAREEEVTYTVVVNQVPVRELLFALVRDASMNADIHPSTEGLVTLNAIDQTFDEVLDRIGRQLAIRFERRDGVLVVEPDTPVLRSYRIDYVNVARDVRSSSSTATQVAAGGEGRANIGNNSSTDIESLSVNRFWDRLTATVRGIVHGGRESPAGTSGIGRSSVPASTAETGAPNAAGGEGTLVIPNPETGILLVRTTARGHREVQAYVDQALASARRQVLIEATIVEVELSDRFEAGVDWSRLASNAGLSVQQNLVSGNLAGAPFFALTYQGAAPDDPARELSVTARLLEEFGDVRVLSSPKLVVLNNQTAVLKAIRNIVYFEVNVETASGTEDSPGAARIDTDARTAPEGIMLAVTPHVSHTGEVVLSVRPTITRVSRFVNDPQPDLASAGVTNPVPELLVREMESVLRLSSGQVAVLGGLMQDSQRTDTDGVPVLSRLGVIGDAFRFRRNEHNKTELVIFIRPRIIRNPGLESEFRVFRTHLPLNPEASRPTPLPGAEPPAGTQP